MGKASWHIPQSTHLWTVSKNWQMNKNFSKIPFFGIITGEKKSEIFVVVVGFISSPVNILEVDVVIQTIFFHFIVSGRD